ncbi:dihydrolipoyl dehydrogenase [Sphingomonas lenta]|uniref:Dihydrolipoyl dehydrogenase n=1 Tax=Sphingomonas lenta TaxID=1141887 RepID=A0A2A2SBM4_9SPHN|nr:dihydrolipoyl dehydrogenase [Sphingomonas lenta]PAX06657.1 dihydrolipoyl dehydrogenase [Sphingomonas lenta]
MSETLTCDVAVIGAGTAGLAAWRAANGLGKRAVIVERGPGGTTCARVGCMPSKLMLAAAKAAEHARRTGMFGVRTGSVEVDGVAVLARMRAERDRFVASAMEGWFAIPEAQRIDGAARFVGPTALEVEGGPRIEAGAVVIATGGRPAVPPVLDPVRSLVRTYEDLFEIPTLPRRVAVLGAGPLGLEQAQAFRWLGAEVTVIDDGATVAKLEDPDVARVARDIFAGMVDLRLEQELEAAKMAEGAARLRWAGGEGTFDLVISASGIRPELKPLNLEAAGLKLDEHGTPEFDPVTRRCGDSAVFMAGDAAADRPVLHEASRTGESAGAVAVGGAPLARLPELAMTFTEPEVVLVGCGYGALPEGHRIGRADFGDNGRVTIDGGRDAGGLLSVYADREGRLLGGAIVGPGAEHVGHLLCLAVAQGMSAGRLADQAFYHPCVEEVLRAACRDLLAGN